MDIRQPHRITHSFRQHLIAAPEVVFRLLCPVREAEWAQGWDPALVLSVSGVAEPDCIFLTDSDGAEAMWVITHHDPSRLHIEMLKVTPGHTVGKIEIQLYAREGGSEADISYTYTALASEGEAWLAGFTPEYYEHFMREWETELNRYLGSGKGEPGSAIERPDGPLQSTAERHDVRLLWPTPGHFGYPQPVSPTVLRVRGYRFYFFSREEPRPHVHVHHANGEAKCWLEPRIELASDYGLGPTRVNVALKIIEEHHNEIRAAWAKHFGG